MERERDRENKSVNTLVLNKVPFTHTHHSHCSPLLHPPKHQMDRNSSLIQGNHWWNKPYIPVWLSRAQEEPILSKNKGSGGSGLTHDAAEWLAGWLLGRVSLIWPFKVQYGTHTMTYECRAPRQVLRGRQWSWQPTPEQLGGEGLVSAH